MLLITGNQWYECYQAITRTRSECADATATPAGFHDVLIENLSIDVSELHGSPGLPCMGEMSTSLEVAGNVRTVMLAGGSPLAGLVNPAGPDGPVVAGGPVGPCDAVSNF